MRVAWLGRDRCSAAPSCLVASDGHTPCTARASRAQGHTPQVPFLPSPGRVPSIHPSAFVHSAAHVIGDVTLGARASVWPTCVLRGDTAPITVGDDTNIQDGTIVHVDRGVPCTIGARVAVGHRAIVHGATVEDDVMVGMGAILLNRVVVGSGSIIGAGAVVREGMVIPANSLVLGVPGRIVRETTIEERERIARTVASYLALQVEHAAGRYPALSL
jgi:carbonic anhydrase/acetyltransferase-like protein (isoleucine patch superfamily)